MSSEYAKWLILFSSCFRQIWVKDDITGGRKGKGDRISEKRECGKMVETRENTNTKVFKRK